MIESTNSTCWFLKQKLTCLCFLFSLSCVFFKKNINQSDFALFVMTLIILLQAWFRKILSLGTLAIALAKELLTWVIHFLNISDQFIFSYLYLRLNSVGRVQNFRKKQDSYYFFSSWKEFKKIFRTVGCGGGGIENSRTREG